MFWEPGSMIELQDFLPHGKVLKGLEYRNVVQKPVTLSVDFSLVELLHPLFAAITKEPAV